MTPLWNTTCVTITSLIDLSIITSGICSETKLQTRHIGVGIWLDNASRDLGVEGIRGQSRTGGHDQSSVRAGNRPNFTRAIDCDAFVALALRPLNDSVG